LFSIAEAPSMTAWAARTVVHGFRKPSLVGWNWPRQVQPDVASRPRMRQATLGTERTMTYTSTTEILSR
jgi:hypothetical protein